MSDLNSCYAMCCLDFVDLIYGSILIEYPPWGEHYPFGSQRPIVDVLASVLMNHG